MFTKKFFGLSDSLIETTSNVLKQNILDLEEARRNAHLTAQKRSNALERLSKWKDASDIHISYTRINKIGFNPNSKFNDTPLAIYAYPLKEIWQDIEKEGVRNVQFAANTSKYIFVLKEQKKLKNISDYSIKNLESDLQKIRDFVDKDTYEKEISNIEKTPGVSKNLPYRYLQYFIYRLAVALKKNPDTSLPLLIISKASSISAFISNIMIKLGYYGFADRKGSGQIHPAEDIQSFFLTPNSYKIVDIIEIKEIDIKDASIRDLADYIKKNASTMSDDELIEIISNNDLSLAKYMGSPRTKVIKELITKKQSERWGSKQHRRPSPDYDGIDYVPAEGIMYGVYIIYYYNKLPEELLSWGISQKDFMISGAIVDWMKTKKYKPSESFIEKNIKYNFDLLDFVDNISKKAAREVIKHHGYIFTLSQLSKKMTERDFMEVMSSIKIDIPSLQIYDEKMAKVIYKNLMDKRNPTDNDIAEVASYINKGNRNPPMDIINSLKQNFPDFDFTKIGAWGFWKR